MRLGWALMFVALAGCNAMVREDRARSIAADAADDAANDATAPLREQISELESELADTKEMLRLTQASLDEARTNHDSLRGTFNNNVDASNRLERQQDQRIEYLEHRLGLYR